MWQNVLFWLKDNQIGDITGIIGIIISILGFIGTLIGVSRSKKAAEQAVVAANSARDSIRLFENVVDFTAAITILEEIKRAHRQGAWHSLPDRYSAIRKLLITLRTYNLNLTEHQQSLIQNAVANLYTIESAVERGLDNSSSLKASKFNQIISGDVDMLVSLLTEMKIKQ